MILLNIFTIVIFTNSIIAYITNIQKLNFDDSKKLLLTTLSVEIIPLIFIYVFSDIVSSYIWLLLTELVIITLLLNNYKNILIYSAVIPLLILSFLNIHTILKLI